MVDNSCVTWHNSSHTFAEDETACETCHGGSPDFSTFGADYAASVEALKMYCEKMVFLLVVMQKVIILIQVLIQEIKQELFLIIWL